MRQRWHIGFLWRGICLFWIAVLATSPATTVAQSNPIVVENQQPGSGAWWWTRLADDLNQQIKGYASATSVSQNGNLSFQVTVNPPQTYTIDFYRIGWYAGQGGRLRLHVGPLAGVTQPACPVDASTGAIECQWPPAYTLTVPADWTSGVYAALLTNSQGFQNYVMFVVKDGRPAPFLYQQSVITDQAYNNYPNNNQTGKSLYAFNSFGANTVSGSKAAVKVSFDRPHADSGFGSFHEWELNLIRWLEKSGYDVTYSTDIDTHGNGVELRNHKGFLSTGHSEYWTKEMVDAAASARDAGVNLAFFGGNAVYTQVRLESSTTAVPNRVVVEYRSYPWTPTDPVQGPTTTGDFRWPPINRPEQSLTGLMCTFTSPNTNYIVTNSSHWVYAGTGFQDGNVVPGIVGYESDSFLSTYPPPNSTNRTILANSPFTDGGVTYFQNTQIYQAPSGAWVFATGTMSWSWALDDAFGPLRHFVLDSRIQRATANVLDQFLSSGGDFAVSASPPGQTVPRGGSTGYAVTISPSGGFSGQVSLSVSGLPTGASGSFTPNPSTTASTLTVTTAASTPVGTYTLTITGLSGNLTRTTTASLVVTAPDYTLSASPPSQTVVTGASTSYLVTIAPSDGFAAPVTFTVSGLPAGAGGSFSPNPATTSSTLSVTTSTSTPPGSYTLTITGVSGSLTHTTTVTLVVTSPPDFTIGASPPDRRVTPGASTSYAVTMTPITGFAGEVTLSVGGLPAGASGSFAPNPAMASSTLSVTTSASTPVGTYTLTITGVSGSLTHTTTVTLTMTRVTFDNAVSSGLRWQSTTVTTPSLVIGSGANRAAMIMVSMTDNVATDITASLGGVSGTLIPGTDSGTAAVVRTLIFCVANPPSGAQSATVSWTNSVNGADVGVIAVSGADPATPCTNGTFAAGNSQPMTTSVTILSALGDLTASVAWTNSVWVAPYTNRTLKWGVDSGWVGGDLGSGAGTTTHSWTDQWPLNAHAVSGANFKAASGPDFTLTASPSSRTVQAGGSTSYTVTINPTSGFTDPVSLSISGLPAGASGGFAPNPAATSSTLSLTTNTNTPAGTYTLTITGASGAMTRTTTATLVVSPPPDVTLAVSPPSQAVMAGSSTSYGVTIGPLNGFTGAVTLSASGLPAGASGSFTPNPATTSSTFSVTTTSATPAGSFTVTITGVSGGLTRTTTVTLSVMTGSVAYDNAVSTGLRWQATTITTPSLVIGSGTNRAAMIMVAMTENVATDITASLGGVSGKLIPGSDSATDLMTGLYADPEAPISDDSGTYGQGSTAGVRTLIFCVANPPPGVQTATVSWTNSVNGTDVGVITVSGANPATPCTNGTFAAGNSQPVTTSVTILSAPGDLTASVAWTNSLWVAPHTNQTLKWGVDSGVAGGDIGPGTGTTTHAWTDLWPLNAHAVSGANFKAAP